MTEMTIYGGGNPYRGRTFNRGGFERAYRELGAVGGGLNGPNYFGRDRRLPEGAPEPIETGVMAGLFDADPPDVVFRGCENPGAAAAYLTETKVDALLKGFTAGAVLGTIGIAAILWFSGVRLYMPHIKGT